MGDLTSQMVGTTFCIKQPGLTADQGIVLCSLCLVHSALSIQEFKVVLTMCHSYPEKNVGGMGEGGEQPSLFSFHVLDNI